MKNRKNRHRGLALFAFISVLSVAVAVFPGDVLLEPLRKSALASVGLGHPDKVLDWLDSRLSQTDFAHVATAVAGTKTNASSDPEDDETGVTSYIASSTGSTSSSTTASGTPSNDGSGGKIVTLQMDSGDPVDGVAIKNGSSKTFDIAAELKTVPDVHIIDTTAPQVLILHTHTTEEYMTYDAGYYTAADTARTEDHSKNVVAAGDALAAALAAAGIGVIHDTTVHDSPQYTGAYARSYVTAENILKKYPTVKVIIDLHRDGLMQNSSAMEKPTATVDGQKAAQIMILCSVNSTTANPNPNWKENFHFALRLQQALYQNYGSLMRPLELTDSRYNQNLANGSLLIEIGSQANTVSEATYSASLLGKTMAAVLEQLKK